MPIILDRDAEDGSYPDKLFTSETSEEYKFLKTLQKLVKSDLEALCTKLDYRIDDLNERYNELIRKFDELNQILDLKNEIVKELTKHKE